MEAVTPRWQEADEAVESLVATLVSAAIGTADRSVRKRPRGHSRAKRRPKNTRRHIAEVIRSHRLAPGLRVDRNMVAALLIGHRDLVTNPVLVVAVAQACSIIAGRTLSAKKAARLRAASLRIADLIARAEADTYPVPAPRAEPQPERVPEPVEAAQVVPEPVEVATQPVPEPVDAATPPLVPAPVGVATPPPARPRPAPVGADRPRRHPVRRWWPAAAVLLLVVLALLIVG